MIEIRNLLFRYPGSNFQLTIDELTIHTGERVALVGPSGCGKSTLLNLISGILTPGKGKLSVAGHSIEMLTDRNRRDFRIANLGFVFQRFELIPYLNVWDNLLFPFRINPSLRLTPEVLGTARELLGRVGLLDKVHRFPQQLSQGEQQRAAICRALVHRPSLVLADEPTGNLDAGNRDAVMRLLFEQVDRAGQTLLVVTHDANVVSLFDRVIDLTEGAPVAEPSP